MRALIRDEASVAALLDIACNDDSSVGLDVGAPEYTRALLAAELASASALNNHIDEVRYNVFQAVQYLASWLRGDGCVALPTTTGGVAVRVMDDLATTERSRWEVFLELHHRRLALPTLMVR